MKHFLLALSCLCLFTSAARAIPEPPNLILILADDLGWADLACYGNTFNETPHLDRLAREGMRFTQFYAGPVCSPTRSNLQSGQDQARFGITQHIPGHKRPFAKLTDPAVPHQLPLEVETYAERLRTSGYAAGYFGKWHLGGPGFGPQDQGWETALEAKGHTQSSEISGTGKDQRTTDYLADKAIAFISQHKDHPFVLQVSHIAVHIPLSTTPELEKKYQAKKPMPGYPSNPQYAGLLEELDQSVGRIVQAVDQAGLAEKTLILFLSDNGGIEHMQNGGIVTSNKPLRGEKGTLYEGGIRVPAIARWTGRIPSGSECTTPAITTDVYPTFTELGGAIASSPQPQDGVSLAALLRNPSAKIARDNLYWHLPHYHHSTPASAIRQGNLKLIEFYETDTVELYDLKADLGETTDLAQTQPAKAASMRSALAEWRLKVNARMPVPNPDYNPARADELAGKKKGGKNADAAE
ncbi:putative sulfatase [Prosthecobacter fusiformis]|uniref:Putative sulfatase n=1 Tax=Prosthecobacter fusiformis TaxID=48464 RepID=A0A4R7S5K3_9BACT|nr:sulfatase [Prosthecobacter fusiformis]TDU72818.1 putative sulfatase [Prosthecobacter fusiformis]